MSEKTITPMLLLGVAALLAGAGVFYHYVVTVPQQARAKQAIETKRLEQEEKHKQDEQTAKRRSKELLDACLSDAYSAYSENWKKACRKFGRFDDCVLPSDTADTINESLAGYKNDCFRKYPQR